MAGMSTLKQASDLFKVTEWGDVLESGPYKDHTKFYKYVHKTVPVLRQVERTLDPSISNEFLKK